MKLQRLKELLKAVIFSDSQKTLKNTNANRLYSKRLKFLFQNRILFTLTSLFYKECFTSQIRINKMITSIVSITTLVPQDQSWLYTLSYFLRALNTFICPQNLCGILFQTCLSCHGWRTFSNLWGSDYWKMYFASQKTESRHF